MDSPNVTILKSTLNKKITEAVKEDHDWRMNPLTPNDAYRGRTLPLTSKFAFNIFIQQI